MRNLVFRFIFFSVFFLYSFTADAFNYGKFISCNAMNPTPKIVFKTSYGKLQYHFDKNVDQISAMLTEKNHEKGVDRASGLATLQWGWYVYVSKGITKKIAKDVYCVMPKEVQVYVGYQNPGIYVASDYKSRDALYASIMRHEQGHQWINKATLDYFLPLFFSQARTAIREVRAVKIYSKSDIDAAYEQLNKYYEARLEPVWEEFKRLRELEHSKFDNAVNYSEEHKLVREYEAKKKLMEKYDTQPSL